MSRRREEALIAGEIAKLRVFQQQLAELKVLQAATTVQIREAARAEAHDKLDADQHAWLAHHGRGSFEPRLATAWASSIVQSGIELREAEVQRSKAQAVQSRAASCWNRSRLEMEYADDLARLAQTRAGRAIDDERLAEAIDRMGATWPSF